MPQLSIKMVGVSLDCGVSLRFFSATLNTLGNILSRERHKKCPCQHCTYTSLVPKPQHVYRKSSPSQQWRKEWRTKKNKVELWQMIQVLELLGWRKGTSQDEATLVSEEIKPVAITIIELCLSECISQSVSRKFC